MISAGVWLESHFNDFRAIFGATPPVTCEFRSVIGGENFTSLYLLSSQSDWMSSPYMSELLSRVDSTSLPTLERAFRARPWEIADIRGSIYIGTADSVSGKRGRSGEFTRRKLVRQLRSAASFKRAEAMVSGYPNWGAGLSSEAVFVHPYWKAVEEAFDLTSLGAPKDAVFLTASEVDALPQATTLPSPRDSCMSLNWEDPTKGFARDIAILKKFGPGRTVMLLPVSSQPSGGSCYGVVAWSVPAFDDCASLNVWRYLNNYFTTVSEEENVVNLNTNSTSINSWKVGAVDYYLSNITGGSSIDSPLGELTVGLMASKHGKTLLPLLSTPGECEFAFRALPSDISVEIDNSMGWEHRIITIDGDVLIGIPIDWYTGYVTDNAKAVNKDQMAQAIKDLAPYAGMTMCSVSYKQALPIVDGSVSRLRIAVEYKKAKEKACEVNDFMSRKYVDNVTYGDVEAKLNQLNLITDLFGYRDTVVTSNTDLSEAWLWTGWKLEWNSATSKVNTKTPAGMTGPSILKGDEDHLLEMYYGGATMTTGTLNDVCAAWSLPYSDVVSRASGIESSKLSLQRSAVGNATTAGYGHFSADSVGFYGYPDVVFMTTEEATKAVMLSIYAAGKLGTKMRSLFLSYGRDSIIRSLLTSKNPTAAP